MPRRINRVTFVSGVALFLIGALVAFESGGLLNCLTGSLGFLLVLASCVGHLWNT